MKVLKKLDLLLIFIMIYKFVYSRLYIYIYIYIYTCVCVNLELLIEGGLIRVINKPCLFFYFLFVK